MISNQILQNTIDGLKGITRINLCVLDMEGQILARKKSRKAMEVKSLRSLHLRQTARWYMAISSLKYLMRTS